MLALKDTDSSGITRLLKGQTCLAYSDDPIAAARISVKYSKENDKLVILGGAMGKTMLDANAVKALAILPSLDSKIIGLVQRPRPSPASSRSRAPSWRASSGQSAQAAPPESKPKPILGRERSPVMQHDDQTKEVEL